MVALSKVTASNTANKNSVKTRLKSLLVTLTQLAEYQLMAHSHEEEVL
jgi:hypothetical protein